MTSAASNASKAPQPPAIQEPTSSSPPSKRDLRSWWKGFKSQPRQLQDPPAEQQRPKGIFGVPLRQSITYANVAISLVDENGQSYIYGYVPIVVAKCGVFLKETATTVPGIFRLSGSEKRIKDLKTIFDSPDRYGKGLDWEGYNVHDAANVLRRYLNDLPEPVVPLDLYEKFRDPLRGATKQAVGDAEGPQFVENFDEKNAIIQYQHLITELPPLNRQLLLYILDLLAVFAAKSEENLMTSHNLSAIFQPGMLSHPVHAMAPEEYRLNQCVLIFLIENQDHFLIGMQGTAADEETKNDIARGLPPTSGAPASPNQNRKSGLGRSASNASAGADSVRREGMVRRHRSVSSRNSRQDGDVTPNSPGQLATPSSSGIGRSNTVPSKKSPALQGRKFKNASPGQQTSTHVEPLSQMPLEEVITPPSESNLAPPFSGGQAPSPSAGRSQERLLDPQDATATPSKEKGNLGALFQRSPADSGDKRQPRKLQKKKLPGSLNPSAQSSTTSLGNAQQLSGAVSPTRELVSSPLDSVMPVRPAEELPKQSETSEPREQPPALNQQTSDLSSEPTPKASQLFDKPAHHEAVLRAKKSPSTSLHSSFNEGADLDQTMAEAAPPIPTAEQEEREKKSRWRLSRTRNDESGNLDTAATHDLGSNRAADVSTTSVSSSGYKGRKSFTNDSSEPTLSGNEGPESGKESHEESKGLFGRIKSKYREAKERTKSPPPSDGHGIGRIGRGKSLDIKRENRDPEPALNAAAVAPVPTSAGHSQGPNTVTSPTQANTTMAPPADSTLEAVPEVSPERPAKEEADPAAVSSESVPSVIVRQPTQLGPADTDQAKTE